MQVVYAVFLVMTLPSFLSMTARVGNLMKAVGRYAAGDTSYVELGVVQNPAPEVALENQVEAQGVLVSVRAVQT